MLYTLRPISDRTPFTGKHVWSDFDSTWSATQQLLARELRAINAKNVVLEVDFRERDLRLDGQLRADARCQSPAVRLAFDRSWMLLTFTIGVLFLAAAATFLGFVSSNAKTFTVLFLTFWYVAVNDKGASPAFDFAGFNGSATPVVTGVYALLAMALIGAAQMTHVMRVGRS